MGESKLSNCIARHLEPMAQVGDTHRYLESVKESVALRTRGLRLLETEGLDISQLHLGQEVVSSVSSLLYGRDGQLKRAHLVARGAGKIDHINPVIGIRITPDRPISALDADDDERFIPINAPSEQSLQDTTTVAFLGRTIGALEAEAAHKQDTRYEDSWKRRRYAKRRLKRLVGAGVCVLAAGTLGQAVFSANESSDCRNLTKDQVMHIQPSAVNTGVVQKCSQ